MIMIDIFHNLAEAREFLWITHYLRGRPKRSSKLEGSRQQRSALKLEECFICTHAGAFAACKDEDRKPAVFVHRNARWILSLGE